MRGRRIFCQRTPLETGPDDVKRFLADLMEAMRLPKSCMAVILGKHISNVYRELARNAGEGIYTAASAPGPAGQRRLQTKPRPKTGNAALMGEVKRKTGLPIK